MTVKELSRLCGFEIMAGADAADKTISNGYACDLLSWVIGRAQVNDALITVMSNMNVIAVAVMADLSCVIMTEGVTPDPAAVDKAQANKIPILKSELPTYETSLLIASKLAGADADL